MRLAPRLHSSALALLCAAGLCFAGCGRDDDARAAGLVSERFVRAVAADDGDAACAQLSPDTARTLERDEGEPCAEAARGLPIAASAVRRAQVFGVSAKVDFAGGDSAFLELTPSGWKVAAAGCRPVAREQPYECELEA